MRAVIVRVAHHPQQAMCGVWSVEGADGARFPLCVTLENPWRPGGNDSCVPAGRYHTTRWKSPTKGPVFRLHAVPGRSDILVHVGNTEQNSLGCILPGERFGKLYGLVAVKESLPAMTALLAAMPDEFELEIVDAWGGSTRDFKLAA